jgi:hypothetical protein
VSGSGIEPMRSDIEEGETRTPFVEKDKQYPENAIFFSVTSSPSEQSGRG